MPIITSIEAIEKLKTKDKVDFVCDYCNEQFQRTKGLGFFKTQGFKNRKFFCNNKCQRSERLSRKPKHAIECKQCKNMFQTYNADDNRKFCSQSCAATYNNTHKTHGTRRSKLEIWLERQLISLYPNIEIHFNRKDTINSELDIYIPSLKLAFELNGIYHYEPIHSAEQLSKIQNNDKRKFQACLERGIELCIIDTSRFLHFKENKAIPFLTIITDILDVKLSNI